MKQTLILVEDDPQQSESIRQAVERHFRDLQVQIMETEAEFCAWLNGPPADKPRAIICDVMLPWTFPEPNTPEAPPEVEKGTFREAGVRCWKRLRNHPDFHSVPLVFFTVLDHHTVHEAMVRGQGEGGDTLTRYVQKSSSIEPLLKEIGELLQARQPSG